jgi:hypothetical protein
LLSIKPLIRQFSSEQRKSSIKPRLDPIAPGIVYRTVAPKRRPNADLRSREYLTDADH